MRGYLTNNHFLVVAITVSFEFFEGLLSQNLYNIFPVFMSDIIHRFLMVAWCHCLFGFALSCVEVFQSKSTYNSNIPRYGFNFACWTTKMQFYGRVTRSFLTKSSTFYIYGLKILVLIIVEL